MKRRTGSAGARDASRRGSRGSAAAGSPAGRAAGADSSGGRRRTAVTHRAAGLGSPLRKEGYALCRPWHRSSLRESHELRQIVLGAARLGKPGLRSPAISRRVAPSGRPPSRRWGPGPRRRQKRRCGHTCGLSLQPLRAFSSVRRGCRAGPTTSVMRVLLRTSNRAPPGWPRRTDDPYNTRRCRPVRELSRIDFPSRRPPHRPPAAPPVASRRAVSTTRL